MAETDFFRDTNVRYLGYANEVGEALGPVVSRKVVRASYGVAFAYVFADTLHKCYKSLRKDGSPKMMALEGGDALIWQTFASVLIPGFTINRVSAFSQKTLQTKLPKIPVGVRKVMSVGIGLATIPIIVGPIDYAVHKFMDLTYRRWIQ